MGVTESGWGSSQLYQGNLSPSILSLSVSLPDHAGGREELRSQGSKMSLSLSFVQHCIWHRGVAVHPIPTKTCGPRSSCRKTITHS